MVNQAPANMMRQVRHNMEEVNDMVKDLYSWEKTIKKKDAQLHGVEASEKVLPPVRGGKRAVKTKPTEKAAKTSKQSNVKVIPGEKIRKEAMSNKEYFEKWDRVDVDKMLESDSDDEAEEIIADKPPPRKVKPEQPKKATKKAPSTKKAPTAGEPNPNPSEKDFALLEKDKGNSLFKSGDYQGAVECYTRAHELDSQNPVFLSNRAMALVKLSKWAEAERDCIDALAMNPEPTLSTKLYARRGHARLELNKFQQAKTDLETAAKAMPKDAVIRSHLNRVKDKLNPPAPPKSKKKIIIEEIGDDEEVAEAPKPASPQKPKVESPKAHSAQSNQRKKIVIEEDSSSDEEEVVPVKKKVESPKSNKPASPKKVQPVKSSKEASSDATTPPPPKTFYEFEKEWRSLRKRDDLSDFSVYFSQIDADTFPVLFKESMDGDIMADIVASLEFWMLEDKHEDVMRVLDSLTKVKRFDMCMMLMAGKEQAKVKKVIDMMKASKWFKSAGVGCAKVVKKYV